MLFRFAFLFWLFFSTCCGSTLLEDNFVSDVSSFTGGGAVYSSADGADFQPGLVSFTTSNTGNRAILSFEEQSVGHTIVSFCYKITDTLAPTNSTSGDDFIYCLPSATDANAAVSNNGVTAFNFSRNTANGGSTTNVTLMYRDSTNFKSVYYNRRGNWFRVTIDIDHAADTFDLYVDGRLFIRNVGSANNGQATIGKIVILHQSSSTVTLFDDFKIESNAEGLDVYDNLLIEHDFTTSLNGEIETLYTDVDNRSIYPQLWKIPDNTTFGAFTVNANGAVADSNKQCGALIRATSEGKVEVDFKAASSGKIGGSILDRVWAGFDNDSYIELRYDKSNTGAELRLYQGTTGLGSGVTPDDNAATTAGSNYTLGIVRRGRVLDAYFNGVLEYSYTITGTGNRGQLSEEHAGFYIDTRTSGLNLDTTNYVRAIRIYGYPPKTNDGSPKTDLPPVRHYVTIGNMKYGVEADGVKFASCSDYIDPHANLGWSKFIQFAHLSEADPNVYGSRSEQLYSGNKLKSFHFMSNNMREDTFLGTGCFAFCTITPRGVWVREGLTYWASSTSDYAPDHDFRTELWSDIIKSTKRTSTGVITNYSVTKGFDDWNTDWSSANSGSFQVITNNGSGNKVLLTSYIGQKGGNLDTNFLRLASKRLGCLDPMSIAFSYYRDTLSNGDSVVTSRCILFDVGPGVTDSNTFRTNLLNDLEQPAILSVLRGTLVTNADGDSNNDGFNEQYGWYEVTANNSSLLFLFDGVTDRVRPQLHISNMLVPSSIFVDGVPQVEGTDYWWTDDGSNGILIGFYNTINSDAIISITKQRFNILNN